MSLTVPHLAAELDERGLSLTIHNASATAWVVWLFPSDDPAQIYIGEGSDLEQAILGALAQWDGDPTAPDAGDEPLVMVRLADGGCAWRRKETPLGPGERHMVAMKQEDGTVLWQDTEGDA